MLMLYSCYKLYVVLVVERIEYKRRMPRRRRLSECSFIGHSWAACSSDGRGISPSVVLNVYNLFP